MDPRTRQNCQAKWQAASLCEDEDSACRLQLDWDDCNSLDQDSAPAVEPLLDEAIGGGEMLEEVFVVDIVSTMCCLKGLKRAASNGVRRTETTWVMFACWRASRRRRVNMPPMYRFRSPGTLSMRAMAPTLICRAGLGEGVGAPEMRVVVAMESGDVVSTRLGMDWIRFSTAAR